MAGRETMDKWPWTKSSFRRHFHRRGVARQGRRLRDLAVAQRPQHLQHLAPGRERPAVVALVLVHRLHEDDLVVGVVALAGGRVDLPAALALRLLAALAALGLAAAVERHRDDALAAL